MFDSWFRDYSYEEEFIARDLIIVELLIKKGVITEEEFTENFADKLKEKLDQVKKAREEEVERLLEDYKNKKVEEVC